MSFILSLLGLLLIIEGLPYFAFPGKVKDWSIAMQQAPDKGLRVVGFIAMAAGLFLVFLGKRIFS